ncbi:unnamed protein product [Musa acuminata subsp. burmannicoides]
MSSNLLGVTRSGHEDVKWLERLIVRELQREPANDRDRLLQSHRGNLISQSDLSCKPAGSADPS